MKKIFILIPFFLQTIICTAQQVDNIFDLTEKRYLTAVYYSYNLDYKFYENETATTAIEKQNGMMLKTSYGNYQEILGQKTLITKEYNLAINDKNKLLKIAKISKQTAPVALKTYFKIFSKKTLIPDIKYWICELALPKDKIFQYSKIQFVIDKKDYSIYKEIFFVPGAKQITKNKKKVIIKNSRLEITFINRPKNSIKDNNLTNTNSYFFVKNNKITATKRFEKYKLITI